MKAWPERRKMHILCFSAFFHPASGEGAPLAFAWGRLRQGAREPQWGACGYFPPALSGPLHRETK